MALEHASGAGLLSGEASIGDPGVQTGVTVADLDAASAPHILGIPVAERAAVVPPDGVLDDRLREPVAVGFRLSHRR